MALKWLHIDDQNTFGLEANSTTISAAVDLGEFLGVNTSGKAVLADSGEGDDSAVEAKGASWSDGTYGTSDVTLYKDKLSYVRHGKLYGFSGLTIGGTCYLSSGGGITQTEPTKVGAIKQVVGFALTADTIWVDIHPAETLS
jgi:hypothetical protein